MTGAPRKEHEDAREFRRRPIVILALRWTGDNQQAIHEFTGGAGHFHRVEAARVPEFELVIDALEGLMHPEIGDWVIRGVQGEFYSCKPDIFAVTYEPVANGVSAPRSGANQKDVDVR